MTYEEIMSRRTELSEGPIFAIPEEAMVGIQQKLEQMWPKSKLHYQEAIQCIPGGVQHMLANKRPFPQTIKNARGSKIWDVDDNEYVDYLMMAGPIILGHNYAPLIDAVTMVIQEEGVGTGWTSKWEINAIEQIKKHIPSIELFRYFQSGTEADMAAARIARVYTGKKKIVKLGGAYHGWADQFVYDMHVPFTGKLDSHGIPDECFEHIIAVPPNDLDSLEKAFKSSKNDGGIAAVFIEPLGGESGAIPMHPDYPKAVREMCDIYETLLIFDEVVSAFRISLGGAQEFYNVRPDLTILGKILTHGFPSSGGVGGQKDIMECFVVGLQPGKGSAFVGGTMGANPISTSATYWTLKFIEEENAIEKAAQAADKLVSGLHDLFEKSGFPFFAYNFKSIVHFETAAPIAVDLRKPDAIMSALNRKKAVDDLCTALLLEGVITKYGNRAFTCMAHSDEDIEFTLQAFEKILKLIPG